MKKITKKSVRENYRARHIQTTDEQDEMIRNFFFQEERESCETQREYVDRIHSLLN